MAEATKITETWRPNVPPTSGAAAAKYGGHEVKEAGSKTVEQPNPSDPGNTGTTPGTVADVG